MGNLCHAGPVLGTPATTATASGSPTKKPVLTFGRDPTLRREDFIFRGIQGPSSLTKLPGSVNGQQFLIEGCRDCDIFLLDHCASVQIDECVNCRIVIGPCESSLFLRDCKDCTIVCAVQQFRSRDCSNVDVYLYSATEPIIETSSKMRFACFPLTYFSLQQQFDKAKFSVWNNRWSEIYNFTPDHGAWKTLSTQCHESAFATVMEKQPDGGASLWKMPSWTAEELGLTTATSQLVVPLTSGLSVRSDLEQSLLVIFAKPMGQVALDFVHEMTRVDDGGGADPPPLLLRTRQLKLSPERAKVLFASNTALVEKATSSGNVGSIVLEFQGPSCYERLEQVRQSPKVAGDVASSSGLYASADTAIARRMSEWVFVKWKDVV